MTDFRTVLDEQIGELPPSTVDVRRIVAAQRRMLLVRRVAAGTGAAGAVVAVLLGLSVLSGGGAPATVPGGRPAPVPRSTPATTQRPPVPTPVPTCPGSASATPSRSPWIDPSAPPTTAPDAAVPLPIGAEDRLTAALRAAARPETRGLRLDAFDDDGVVRPPLEFFGGPCASSDRDNYLATAVVTGAGGRHGMVSVYVQTTPAECDPGGCTTQRRPDGTVVRTRSQSGDLQGQQMVRVIVMISKPDGTVVQLVADCPIDGEPVLSAAALERIGLHPGLTLDL